jgi:hypothetical protein
MEMARNPSSISMRLFEELFIEGFIEFAFNSIGKLHWIALPNLLF